MFSFLTRPANIPFAVPKQQIHYVFAYSWEEAQNQVESIHPPGQITIELMGKTTVAELIKEVGHMVDLKELSFTSDLELEIQNKVLDGMFKAAKELTSGEKEASLLKKVILQLKSLNQPHVPLNVSPGSETENSKVAPDFTVPGSDTSNAL